MRINSRKRLWGVLPPAGGSTPHKRLRLLIRIPMPATAATHRRHRKQSPPQGRARWRYQHGHGRTSPRPPASRSRLPAVSLHRRGRCLPPLGHHGRLYHHAIRRHGFQRRVSGPMPHALDEPELRCLEHIFRRAVPGVARNAEGTICFSDPQHIEVWRLPAATPPSRDHLQFRLISADYPTAGQKLQRLTTRHRQLRAATRSRLRTTIRAKHETPLTLKPNLPLPPTAGSVFRV